MIEDEHGNRFKPLDLRGWSCLPSNNTLGGGWDGDSGSRIHPGETYRNALYHEYAPPTSKEVVITLPLDGRSLRFRGLIGSKEKLDHEQALEAKAGMVLEAGDLIRAIRDGSKDVKIDYPIGCTMQAAGVVGRKSDQTKSRPDLKHAPYMIWISYDPEKAVNTDDAAVCFTKDKALFDKLKVGDKVTLRGTLKFIPNASNATTAKSRGRSKLTSQVQVHIYDCVEQAG